MEPPGKVKMAANCPLSNDSQSSNANPDAALLAGLSRKSTTRILNNGSFQADIGYVQDLKRNFSVWSVFGVGFPLTNSRFGISTALATGINSRSPVLIIYGIILVALISTSVGISLAELASAMPIAGRQYFWAYELAPPKYAKFAG